MAEAEWLFHELDQPADSQSASPHERRTSDNGEIVRLFYMAHTAGGRELSEMATVVRSVTEIRKMFAYPSNKVLVLRGTIPQLAAAEWLFGKLDKAAGVQAPQSEISNQFKMPGSDDMVRVFYVTKVTTTQALQELSFQVRTIANARRLFVCDKVKALAIRGTAAEVEYAERLVRERDK